MPELTYKNIFEAITYDRLEAEELKNRSDLLIKIRDLVDDQSRSDFIKNVGRKEAEEIFKGNISSFNSRELEAILDLLTKY